MPTWKKREGASPIITGGGRDVLTAHDFPVPLQLTGFAGVPGRGA
jgi:hypothetical protein